MSAQQTFYMEKICGKANLFLAIPYVRCYNVKRSFLKGGISRESKIISKTYLREMQGNQEKRENHDYL